MNQSGDCIRVVHPLFQEEGSGSTPTSPLQLQIGRMDVWRAIELNRAWHSRLPDFASPPGHCIAYGAEFDSTFYAVAIWSPPVARMLNGRGMYELRRLAIADDAPKNTATRMLRIMRLIVGKTFPAIRTLISYQDTGAHAGTIYKAAGWTATNTDPGGEWSRPSRQRAKAQASTPKIRWEIAA